MVWCKSVLLRERERDCWIRMPSLQSMQFHPCRTFVVAEKLNDWNTIWLKVGFYSVVIWGLIGKNWHHSISFLLSNKSLCFWSCNWNGHHVEMETDSHVHHPFSSNSCFSAWRRGVESVFRFILPSLKILSVRSINLTHSIEETSTWPISNSNSWHAFAPEMAAFLRLSRRIIFLSQIKSNKFTTLR